ncbi:hypothetical protein FNU77_00345 (plasmid) [Prescottella equi]|uniref:Uncharacterized protein n=1 Tax=Rhodococcus hoagii TaxID=43767 RepID=B4F368_RHOHA|nr:DUF6615 family protein [Prescottella equi]ARX59599.1 hypothetical protein pVAPB1475_0750 [Prescottella equi]ARX60561.1 hypothetical protein pVAPB1413_0750 [Prescottella equi]ARX60667.1 hypothetical protein pVAPB1533_0750 [Prescottella equi]QDP08275.1 hypothetical protein FNU77_00345 [Prescottella equi]CAQ30342.1 hypothetical protein pVAPB_0750 [Prescottella equi]
MPLNLLSLIRDMDRLSAETWDRIKIGDLANLKFREDSITDELLFTLMRKHPQLAVKRFNQYEEKSTGADWEWWIGSRSFGWFRLRIQAKRVHGKKYKQLDHRGDIDAGHEFQYQTLIADCQDDDATYPFHVFFNGWPETRFSESFKSDHEDRCGKLAQELWGCAAVSSYAVHDLHFNSKKTRWARRADVPRYMPVSLPWSRLFTLACKNMSDIHTAELGIGKLSPRETFTHMHSATLVAEKATREGIFGDSTEMWQDALRNHLLTDFILELPDYARETQDAWRFFASRDYFEDNQSFPPRSGEFLYRTLPDTVLVLDLESD